MIAKKKKAIKLLIYDGSTISETAEKVEVSVETLNKWMENDREFIKEMERLMRPKKEMASKLIAANLYYAIDAISDLSKNATSENVRLQAAREIINYTKDNKEGLDKDGEIVELINEIKNKAKSKE